MIRSRILALGTAAVLVALLAACGQNTTAVAQQPAPTATVTAAAVGAPEPVAPEDGTTFVDSNVTLQWEWPAGLGANQSYAVQLWVDEQPPQEIWTGETSLNVKQAIDSTNRDTGTFHWKVVVINASAATGFQGTASAWSPVQTLNRVRRIVPTPLPEAQQSDTARFFTSKHFANATALIDYAREFIYTYSTYGKQEPGKPDRSDTLQKIYLHYLGQGPGPVLLCDGLTTSMLTLLKELGLESRLIFLYAEGKTSIGEHTVLEVFNPDTQRWEVTDPTYNVYFVDTTTGQRASIARLVFGSMDTIKRCDGCSAEGALKSSSHFQAYRIGYTNTFYVNPDRFDVSHRFSEEKNHNLAEYLTGVSSDFSFVFGPPADGN